MERLTGKDELGYYAPRDITLNCLKQRGELIDRLARYEATGFEPEDLDLDLNAAVRRKVGAEYFGLTPEQMEHAVDLFCAEREGRLVELPVAVGSTVYTLFCGEVVEKRIGRFHVNSYTEPQIWAELDCDYLASQTVRWDMAIGKTVFLSRPEAEAALAASGKEVDLEGRL